MSIQEKAKSALAQATKKGTMSGLNANAIEATLLPYKEAIAKALPNGQKPDAIIQAAVFAISTNPALKECSVHTLIGAVLHSSILGLNPALGQCHYIPRKNKNTGTIDCQFHIDYKGLIALCYRSGQVKSIYAEVVRHGDTFEYERGTSPRIKHIPNLEQGGEMYAAYAVVEFAGGGKEFVLMGKSEIEKRRMESSNQNSHNPTGIWLKWGEEMWKKTTLRNLLKIVPLATTQSAIAADDRAVSVENVHAGELAGTIEIPDGSDVVTAPDLEQIIEGVEACNDLETLENYWKQGAAEWQYRQDVKDLFNKRKEQLQ